MNTLDWNFLLQVTYEDGGSLC